MTASKKTLTEALSAFQENLPSVTLDGDNPHFKSKFTTLANLTNIVLPELVKHGFAFTATPQVTENGFVLKATLLHDSGDQLSASFPITETNPQKVGSAITYYRRYALAALTGVVADIDDDGNAASTVSPAQQKIDQAAQRKIDNARPKQEPKKGNARATIKSDYLDTGKIDRDDLNRLFQEAKKAADNDAEAMQNVLDALRKEFA